MSMIFAKLEFDRYKDKLVDPAQCQYMTTYSRCSARLSSRYEDRIEVMSGRHTLISKKELKEAGAYKTNQYGTFLDQSVLREHDWYSYSPLAQCGKVGWYCSDLGLYLCERHLRMIEENLNSAFEMSAMVQRNVEQYARAHAEDLVGSQLERAFA